MKNTNNKSRSFLSLQDGDEFLVNGFLKTVVSTGWGPQVGSCVKADDGKYYHDSMIHDGLDVTFSADFQISRRAAIAAVYHRFDDATYDKMLTSLKNIPASGTEELNGQSWDLINREQAFEAIRSIDGVSDSNRESAMNFVKGMLICGEKNEDEKRVFIAKANEIEPVIDTPAHPAFRLELVVDQFAIYFNPGDDVRVVVLDTKKLLENDIGIKKYNEIMEQIAFEGKGYEFGSVYANFAKKKRAQFHKKHTLSEQIKSASSRANETASSASTKTKVQESQR